MGTTLWVVSKANMSDGDDWDHSALFNAVEGLDQVCVKAGVTPLSAFFDWTDFNANMDDDEADEFPSDDELRERAHWFEPAAALPTLKALHDFAAANEARLGELFEARSKHLADELLEELDDCIGKVEKMGAAGDLFHLSVVM